MDSGGSVGEDEAFCLFGEANYNASSERAKGQSRPFQLSNIGREPLLWVLNSTVVAKSRNVEDLWRRDCRCDFREQQKDPDLPPIYDGRKHDG